MKTRYTLILFCIIMISCTRDPIYIESIKSVSAPLDLEFSYFPKPSAEKAFVSHQGFKAQYDLDLQTPLWVAHRFDKDHLGKKFDNKYEILSDPSLGRQAPKRILNTRFIHGFIIDPVDLSWSSQSRKEAFYLTNVGLMTRQLSSGMWKKLSAIVRQWVKKYEQLYIISGPVLNSDQKTIPAEPENWFKVIMRATAQADTSIIAFLLPQEYLSGNLERFVVSVDSIESLTNLDFFVNLKDSLENQLESKSNQQDWAIGLGLDSGDK